MGNSQENSSDKIYEIEQYCDSENDFADTEYESDYLSDDGNYIDIRFADERDIISLNTRKRDQPIESTDDDCLLYTSPSPRDKRQSRMPSSA